jgi:hypothetical protein
MSSTPMTEEQRIETIAQVCHEANRAWCVAHGDFSQALWEDAEQWQRDSARAGVKFALGGSTPEEQHEAWCHDKEADGWVYGPVKDAESKTHPCLVDYTLLPPSQKTKDGLFVAIVSALADALALS